MSFQLLCLFSLALQLVPVSSEALIAILDRQCWYEYPLSSVQSSSSFDGALEYVSTISSHSNEDYGPWSYQPVCTEILQSINDHLCVYTSLSFSHGRGISIFTTPTLAGKLASSPAFTDSEALDSKDINVHPGTWQAAAVPGKGIGIIASQPLIFKKRVTAYTPALIAYLETELGMLQRESFWRLAIDQLPDKIREEFLGLTYIFGDERLRVQDITKANTFQINIDGVDHLAVFPETSRLNHACNPNAQYVIDSNLLTHTVQVTRTIAKGEEITISYTSPLDSHATRQEHLQHGFRFTCTCPRCTDSSSSDTVLAKIQMLQKKLNDWSPTSSASPELAEQLMKLHRNEGLEGFMDVAYGFAALAYNAVGNTERAVHFSEKAREAILMKDGTWSVNLQLWEEVLRNPRKHWSYRQRI